MPQFLFDGFVFVALLAGFLWLSEQKKLSRGLAVAGATSWLVGGFVAMVVMNLQGRTAEESAGLFLFARVLPATTAFLYLWSRPDWLPTRVLAGERSQCVYREPGPISAVRVQSFLTDEGVRATAEGQSVWVAQDDVITARRVLPGFIGWKIVHRGRQVTSARFIAAWLTRNGLDAQVRGDMKGGAMGGLPVPESFPDVWVRGADKPRALALITQMDEVEDGEAWTCPWCNEENGPAFASCWSCERAGPQNVVP